MAQLTDDCFAFSGPLMPIDEVERILRERVMPVAETETVRLDAAYGRVMASDVTAPIDLPPFDNSAVDGYAVRHGDLAGHPEFEDQGRNNHDGVGDKELWFRHPAVGVAGRGKMRSQAIREKREIVKALQNARAKNRKEKSFRNARVGHVGLFQQATGRFARTQ